MEHIIVSHIAKHLAANNILIDQGHGFRQRLSCEIQLQQSMTGLNALTRAHVILLDFSKAFDSIPHQRLLLKLDYYGICGKTAAWIKVFLGNRSQVVSVNDTPALGLYLLLYPKAQYLDLFYPNYVLTK